MTLPRLKFRQGGAINLVFVALLMMVLTLAAMSLLYYMRYGHVPLQEVWQRWGRSTAVIVNEIKDSSGMNKEGVLSGQTVTVDAGIRRCTIKGKIVFSDVECSDSNPTTRAVKLVDNKGGEPPKASAASKAQDASEVDVQSKMIDKIIK